jgi:hypothetical protein
MNTHACKAYREVLYAAMLTATRFVSCEVRDAASWTALALVRRPGAAEVAKSILRDACSDQVSNAGELVKLTCMNSPDSWAARFA